MVIVSGLNEHDCDDRYNGSRGWVVVVNNVKKMVTMFNQYWKYLFVTYIDCILKNRHYIEVLLSCFIGP